MLIMTVCMLAVRDGLRYNKSHEWAKADGEVVTVGISDFAQVYVTSVHIISTATAVDLQTV